jgi:hypothetical protein
MKDGSSGDDNCEAMDEQLGEFLGLPCFSFKIFTENRSDAQSVLMLYSAVEESIKRAVKSVLGGSYANNYENRAFDILVDSMMIEIQNGSRGHSSKTFSLILDVAFAKEANEKVSSEDGKGKEKKAQTELEDKKKNQIRSTLNTMKKLRKIIAHEAHTYIDTEIGELLKAIRSGDLKITIEEMYKSVHHVVKVCYSFSKSHEEAFEEWLSLVDIPDDFSSARKKIDYSKM